MWRRQLTIAMAVSLVVQFAVTLHADDPGKTAPDDLTAKKLAAAKKKYDKQMEKAKKLVLDRLKDGEKHAKKAGRLETMKRIVEERKKFESDGTLPSSVRTGDYESRFVNARRDLARALSEAVASYTKKGSLEAAQHTQDELLKLQKEINLDYFYQPPTWNVRIWGGQWSIVRNELVQSPRGSGWISLGDPGTPNYDLEFEAMATEGEGAISVWWHVNPDINTSSYMLIGADGMRHLLSSRVDGRVRRLPDGKMGGALAIGKWYKIKLEVRGEAYRCFLDGQEIFNRTDKLPPKGAVGIGCRNSVTRFRNIEVRAARGKVIWRGIPGLPPQ